MVRKAGVTMIIVGWFCMVGTVGAMETATDSNLFPCIIKGLFWTAVYDWIFD